MAGPLTPQKAFADAVKAAGGQAPFARGVGCTAGNINQLMKKGSPLPDKYVLTAERLYGVSKHLLRPDLYPREVVPAHSPLGDLEIAR